MPRSILPGLLAVLAACARPTPGPARHANWPPTPAGQRFELSLRAYWPDDAVLHGRWTPPAVEPVP